MSEILNIIPKDLVSKNGDATFSPKDAPIFGIYMSAHWCPPCKAFTPVLAKFYEEANKTKKQLEIIFLSADRDEDSFKEYLNTMPWIAVKYDEEKETMMKFATKYNIEGIPSLLFFNQDGELLDKNGRGKIPEGDLTEESVKKAIDKIMNNPAKKPILELIPKELIGKKGNVAFSPKDSTLFAIYFSAHWCGPCRGFTPILAKFYEAANKKKKQIEIIFISSDKDEASFKEYYETMPWLAVKFDDKDTKNVLDDKFEVEGIPTCIVFDQNGEILDKNVRRKVQPKANEKGEFSEKDADLIIDRWINNPAKKNVVELIPKELLGKKGNVAFSPKEAPLFGIYFSAHWCPPCRGFTPILAKFYEAANKNKKQIEIIFISSDRDEASFKEYYETMPWLAVKLDDKDTKGILDEKFEVRGIPTFIVFDQNGEVVDENARGKVQPKANEKGEVSEDDANSVINDWLKNVKK